MVASVIYQSALIYESVMVALYGRHYCARYRAVADLIAPGTSVVDVCCGPAVLYHRYLRQKHVQYTGLDVSEKFIANLRRRQVSAQVWNARSSIPLPRADYVIMQASLYHFLPDADPVLQRMLDAARDHVIIAEPVRNITSSRFKPITCCSRRWTDPGDGHSAHRFTEETFDSFLKPHASRLVSSFLIPGGREKVVVLRAGALGNSA